MKIGSFGDVVFEVSKKKILTPSSFSRSGAAVWADHPMLYKKPKREFMHSEYRKVEMEIKLSALHGVKPRETLKLLYRYMETGKRYHVIVGGKSMSRYKMAIMSISETWDTVLSKGELVTATASITFEETK